MTIGILHPGQMGASVAAAAIEVGQRVVWASQGRSPSTVERAEKAGAADVRTLEALSSTAEILFSVCPPDKAVDLARDVMAHGFRGTYADCNAISPATSRRVSALVSDGGGDYVDGGLIGPPPRKAGSTRLYLSGARAAEVAARFAHSALDARVIEGGVGAASALKMSYAGWTKGSAALMMTMFTLAAKEGVEGALAEEWALSIPGLEDRLRASSAGTAPKAWRFVGEMEEIASALSDAGLPPGALRAAAEVYGRLADFKDAGPTFEEVMAVLVGVER